MLNVSNNPLYDVESIKLPPSSSSSTNHPVELEMNNGHDAAVTPHYAASPSYSVTKDKLAKIFFDFFS